MSRIRFSDGTKLRRVRIGPVGWPLMGRRFNEIVVLMVSPGGVPAASRSRKRMGGGSTILNPAESGLTECLTVSFSGAWDALDNS